MPRYVIGNRRKKIVNLPGILGDLKPYEVRTYDVQPYVVDTPEIKIFLANDDIYVTSSEDPTTPPSLETPTVESGGLAGQPTGPAGGDLSGTYPNPLVTSFTDGSFHQYTITPLVDGEALVVQGGVITSSPVTGMTTGQHKTLRQLVHLADEGGPWEGFASGAYQEILYSGVFPTSVVWWESAAKIKKIVEEAISYNPNHTVNTDQWIAYATDGATPVASFTDSYAYTGVFLTSKTRVGA